MKAIPESMDRNALLKLVSSRISQAVYRVSVACTLSEGEPLVKEDLSAITVQEILGRIKEFVDSDPDDEQYIVFLHYLAKYPVSMCQRKVSPILKFLIGFHYRFGQMYKEEHYKRVQPVSMEELAQIFGRSKATIHECIRDTEEDWKRFLEVKKREEEIEKEAKRQLVEEAKTRLRKGIDGGNC